MLIISNYLTNVQVKPILSKSSKTNEIDQGLSFAIVQAKWADLQIPEAPPSHMHTNNQSSESKFQLLKTYQKFQKAMKLFC